MAASSALVADEDESESGGGGGGVTKATPTKAATSVINAPSTPPTTARQGKQRWKKGEATPPSDVVASLPSTRDDEVRLASPRNIKQDGGGSNKANTQEASPSPSPKPKRGWGLRKSSPKSSPPETSATATPTAHHPPLPRPPPPYLQQQQQHEPSVENVSSSNQSVSDGHSIGKTRSMPRGQQQQQQQQPSSLLSTAPTFGAAEGSAGGVGHDPYKRTRTAQGANVTSL
jgi:hypothetical protein